MDGYTVKFLQPNGRWKTVKNVIHRHLDDLSSAEEKAREGYRFTDAKYWVFTTSKDEIFFIPTTCIFKLMPDQMAYTLKKMQSETGQPIQRR